MRVGICSMQQALTPEAITIVKQAVTLARRRGHAQVTPLHVASTMLASSSSLLKRACLQSYSHPLQYKALELCFNVALNRLPNSSSGPLLGHQSHHPSVSNALVAAFKRAQAHQRRGSIENQQHPILALKIELEQLTVSILDDPSVSRVMREAGFSSIQIKNKVEQALSLEISSQSPPSVSSQSQERHRSLALGSSFPQPLQLDHQLGSTMAKPLDQVKNEDVKRVLDAMMKNKRSTVIVGECLSSSEAVFRRVIEKFERQSEDVHSDFRYMQFIKLPIASFRNLCKDAVEQKILELRSLVKNHASRGVVLYLGDLKWVSDFWSNSGSQRSGYYCSLEPIIMELKKMVSGIWEGERLWLMGIATLRTYMRCKVGHPSLETLWNLHPLTVPADSLGLSLSIDSDLKNQCESMISKDGLGRPLLDRDAYGFERSMQNKESTTINSTSSGLPLWLRQYKEENTRNTESYQELTNLSDKCKLNKESPREHQFFTSEKNYNGCEGKSKILVPEVERNDAKPELLSNPNSGPNSSSSSELEAGAEGDMFKEFNPQNLKVLCDALEKGVPWKKEVIPEIANTILQCRSGMANTEEKFKHRDNKEETWFFFLGLDNDGKEKIAREVAKVVFGSQSNMVSISLSRFSSAKVDSSEETKKKRHRDEMGCSYIERFGEAVSENPHRVFFMEDVEQIDHRSQKGIKQAIKSGKIKNLGGEDVPLKDAIVIFSCESCNSVSRTCSPQRNQRSREDEEKRDENGSQEMDSNVSLDLNITLNGYDTGDGNSVGAIGILESVDRKIMFKVQEL